MDIFLIHLLNLFFPFVKILFQSSWDVLMVILCTVLCYYIYLIVSLLRFTVFISSCTSILRFTVLRFYSYIYLFLSMLHFTIVVVLHLCCVLSFCGVLYILSCLCCVLPILWCYVYATFYHSCGLINHVHAACVLPFSMLRFTFFVVLCRCCVFPFLWCLCLCCVLPFLWSK